MSPYTQLLRQPSVRLILGANALMGITQGVVGVVFNLFLLAVGYDASWIGLLVAWSSVMGFAAAVPVGRLADRLGTRRAVAWGAVGSGTALAASALWPSPVPLLLAQTLYSVAQTAISVSMAPLISEHSRDEERDAMFGSQFAVSTGAGAVGNLLGGWLPALTALALGARPGSALAYRLALLTGALIELAAALPTLRLAGDAGAGAGGGSAVTARDPAAWAPLLRNPLLVRFALPGLIGGIGAGFLIPLQNVFFSRRFGATSGEIGFIFAWSAVAVALAALTAPALARRLGRIRTVVLVEAASIPFLAMMAVVPHLWWAAAASWARSALMNMANPILSAFMMECFSPGERATVNAVATMSWTLGWAVGAQGAGLLMDQVSLTLPLWITVVAYSVSAALYARFFGSLDAGRGRTPAECERVQGCTNGSGATTSTSRSRAKSVRNSTPLK